VRLEGARIRRYGRVHPAIPVVLLRPLRVDLQLGLLNSLESPRVVTVACNRRPGHRSHLIWRPWSCAVEGATVVPYDKVAFGPVVAIDEARAGAVLEEPAQQGVGLVIIHPDN
jgi:hypothetical protein